MGFGILLKDVCIQRLQTSRHKPPGLRYGMSSSFLYSYHVKTDDQSLEMEQVFLFKVFGFE